MPTTLIMKVLCSAMVCDRLQLQQQTLKITLHKVVQYCVGSGTAWLSTKQAYVHMCM